MRYRKLPVEVEVMGPLSYDNGEDLAAWVNGEAGTAIAEFFPDPQGGGGTWGSFINIKTLEGIMRADEGDMIIQGVAGEFYPCKPGVFEETYELVEEVSDGEVRDGGEQAREVQREAVPGEGRVVENGHELSG